MSENYLHLNSEKRELPGFLNVALEPGGDFYSKIINEKNLSEGSYQGIYLNHILEFLSPNQALDVFRECRRLLNSDGVLRVVTRDLDKLVEIYDEAIFSRIKEKKNIPQWITNSCELFNTLFREKGTKWIYIEEEVCQLAREAGFKPLGRFTHGKSSQEALRGLEEGEEFLLIYEFKNSGKLHERPPKAESKSLQTEHSNIDFSELMPEKLDLIDYAFTHFSLKSFADLGGVWGVDGGYTFQTLQKYPVEQSYLVDTNFNERVLREQEKYPQLQIIKGNFGNPGVVNKMQPVDAIFLFDVLLHQVKPDWDEILEMYAAKTNMFIIFNQQFWESPHTVRLFDLGKEEYFRVIPHTIDEGQYRDVFEKMYEIHPQHKRIYRDIHNVWQWGITDADLIAELKQLGFEMDYYHDYGYLGDLKSFKNIAFIFTKKN